MVTASRYAEEKALSERRKKERDEAHLYQDVLVATNDNFQHYQGFDIVPFARQELTDEKAYPKVYRVKKKDTLAELIELVAEELGVSPDFLRPWSMVGRQNGTIRPDTPIKVGDYTIEDIWGKFQHKSVLRLWVEQADKDDTGIPVFRDTKVQIQNPKEKVVLLFLKYFDVETQTLFGVGQFYAAQSDKVSDLAPHILKLLNWPAGQNYRIFEVGVDCSDGIIYTHYAQEIKHGMIEAMKAKSTLHQAELQDGDIVTVQRAVSEKEVQTPPQEKYLDMRDYYDWLLHRVKIKFHPKVVTDENQDNNFELVLNKRYTYNQLAAKVAEHLQVDPTHLRFSPVNIANNRPKAPIKHTTTYQLGQLLSGFSAYGSPSHRHDALYYEVLECSMAELETRKFLKITYLPDGLNKEVHSDTKTYWMLANRLQELHELLVPKNGVVSDIVVQLKNKANIPDDVAERIRVFEAHNYKIHRDCLMTHPVMNFNEYTTLFAEPRLEEELSPGETERLIACFNFDREMAKPWGHPFTFLVKDGEIFSKTKERLSEKLNVKGKTFEKIKFAAVPRSGYGKPEYLTDG